MISTPVSINSQQGKLIAYQCKFGLYIQQLQVQMYYPSSFQVQWKTIINQQLATSKGFNIKNQQHQVKYDQMLTSSIVMVYDKEKQQFIGKDTIIVVNYYLNNKQYEVKQLSRLTLRMGNIVEESMLFRQNYKLSNKQNSLSRKSQLQHYGQQIKCNKLQGSMYNAKLRYKYQLIQCKQSNLAISQINIQQFNNPQLFSYYLKKDSSIINNGNKSETRSSSKSKNRSTANKRKQQQQQVSNSRKLLSRKRRSVRINPHNMHRENINKEEHEQQQQHQQISSYLDDQTTNSRSIKHQTLPSTQQNLSIEMNNNINCQYQYQQQLMRMKWLEREVQEEKKENEQLKRENEQLNKILQCERNQLKRLLQNQANQIKQKQSHINILQLKAKQLQQDISQKQIYFLSNLQKLQQLDQLRYQLIQTKQYVTKLQHRLITKHNQNPQTIQSILLAIQQGSQSSRNNNNTLREMLLNREKTDSQYSHSNRYSVGNKQQNRDNNMNGNMIVSSLTLLDDNLMKVQRTQGVRLSVYGKNRTVNNTSSLSNIQQARRRDTKGTTIADNILCSVSHSQIQLTNSQMRMIQCSTARMQHELSFMHMQLYQVKAQVNFQQQKYQTQCIHHQQTKLELYQLQQQVKKLNKQLHELQNQLINAMEIVQQLNQENVQLKQSLNTYNHRQSLMKRELFKMKESKQQKQYQLNIIIKQQQIQHQSLQAMINNYIEDHNQLMEMIQLKNGEIIKLEQNNIQMNKQLIKSIQENDKLKVLIEEYVGKQKKVNQYLVNLQKQIQQVYKIVQEKELNQDQFINTIKHKQKQISTLQQQLATKQLTITHYALQVDNYKLQIKLLHQQKQNINSNNDNSRNSNNNSNNSQSLLVEKNKQLIAMLNKNTNIIVQYEKQKKQLAELNEELIALKEMNRQLEQVKAANANLIEQHQGMKSHVQLLQKQLSTYTNSNNNNNTSQQQQYQQLSHTAQIMLQQQRISHLHLTQQHLALTEQFHEHQLTILTQKQSLSQLQNKLNKIMKEKKLLQQAIKQLQRRINHLQHSHDKNNYNGLNNNNSNGKEESIKISEFALHDLGVSEIKLQSHIEDSNHTLSIINNNYHYNSNSNRPILHKQNSLPEGNNKEGATSDIMTVKFTKEVEQLRKQLHDYHTLGDINSLLDKKRQQQQANVLMKMIKQHMNSSHQSSELIHLVRNRIAIQRASQQQQQKESKHKLSLNRKQLLSKSKQIQNNLTKYKSKLLRDNRTKSQLVLQTAIQPMKQVENGIKQIISIVQLMS